MFVSLGFYNTLSFCCQNLGIVKIFCAIIISVHGRKKKDGGQGIFYFYLFFECGQGEV